MSKKIVPAIIIVGVVGYLVYSLIVKKEALRPPTPQPPLSKVYEVVRG